MNDCKKKKILISGGPALACDIVKKAKKKNIYTIVTDWYEDSPAKKIADKSFMVSTADINAMVELAKKEKVDAIFTSFIDSNLQNTRKACEQLGFYFYATEEQLESTINKNKFKEMCRKHDISVVPEFDFQIEKGIKEQQKIIYPVIVKPVDSSGSKGIAICNNENELIKGYYGALEYSESKMVIIEKLMNIAKPGINIDYIICDGEIYLSAVGDLYAYQSDKLLPPLTSGVYYPSKYLNEYMEKIDFKVKKMFKNMRFKNGILYIQSFYENGFFYFYEMGYRLGGGQSYQVISSINGINHLEMLIDYSLTGKMCTGKTLNKISPKFDKKGYILILLIKPGKIQYVRGLEKIKKINGIVNVMQSYKEGDYIPKSAANTTQQVFARVHIVTDTDKELSHIIRRVYNELIIIDVQGNLMLIKNINSKFCL